MALIRKMAGLGTAMAVAAVLFGAFSASANAQTPPFTAYGVGLTPGDTISASIDGEACAETTVDADGNWLLPIEADAACGPQDGDTIAFAINGEAAAETATWSGGGAPDDVANGIALTVGDDAGDGDGDGTPAPDPSDTGNAGLLGGAGTSMALVLALGVFAAAMVAGGRTATRRS